MSMVKVKLGGAIFKDFEEMVNGLLSIQSMFRYET